MDFRQDHKSAPAGDWRGADGPRRLVRCFTCGRSEDVSSADLVGYMQTGWPRCCGEVMTYFLEADPPFREQ